MKKLIIIPAYNEANVIARVVTNIREKCIDYDYIVINDCSTDSTREILQKNKINYLDLCSNLGIGGAVQSGYRYAQENGYEIAIQVDGDGQHDVSFLDELVRLIENGEADICIGSRFIKKNGFQSTTLRRGGIAFLSLVIKFLTRQKIYDVTSGFRAVGPKMLQHYAHDYPQDYPEPEAIVTAVRQGAIIKEVPVSMKERQGGKSSINAKKSVYYMFKVTLACIFASLR